MHPASPSVDFASSRTLLRDALEAFLPPDRLGTSEWAARHRWLNNQGGGFVGRWQHDEAPYLVGPMDALDSPDHLAVAVVGPGRCGKTAIAENWLGKSITADPAAMLWYQATEAALQSYVKTVINPMVELHQVLAQRLGPRPIDDSLGFKRFRGMTVEFLTVAYANLISKSAARIVLDEIDAYPEALGDVYALADLRRQTFGRSSKILAVSHPDRARGLADRHWTAGVMKLYGQSNRQLWYWPCPHCNGWSSPNPAAARVMTIEYSVDAPLDEIEQAAALLCPLCGVLVEDHHRRAMNRAGVWIGAGQDIDENGVITGDLAPRQVAGFWIVGPMSPFIIGGIGALARAREAARRDLEAGAENAEQTLKDVVVKRWGIPYDPPRKIGTLDATALADRARADLALGAVPEGVRFLTAFADVQGNRFEVLVRGWGERGESWIIDLIRRNADPATSPEDWDALFAALLDRAWPLAGDDGRAMRLRAFGYDSGGAPGVTQQAYDAWRRWQGRRKIRLLGRFDGRESWTMMPTKGLGTPNAPRLTVVRPDSARKDRLAKSSGAVPIAQFNANTFKDDLAGQLGRALPGPWHTHFPAALLGEKSPHVFFEQLVAETRKPNGVWEKIAARNEALDLMVGTHVIAHLNGLARIDWTRPPAWAAPWDRNSTVVAPDATVAEPQPAPSAAPVTGSASNATASPFNPRTRDRASMLRDLVRSR